jgi:hypothetical protein
MPRGGSGGDSARVIGRRPVRRFDQPRWVMLRSLVVPGWGQATNHAWIKAVLIGGTEVALGAGAIADARALPRLDREVQLARASGDNVMLNAAILNYNQRLERLVSREWLLGGLIAYSLVDAYVDAHFRNFKIEFEHDPALPEGRPGAPGVRASLRRTF